jgi:hypothetical protein
LLLSISSSAFRPMGSLTSSIPSPSGICHLLHASCSQLFGNL